MSSFTIPGVGTLTSTALTDQAMGQLIQTLLLQMLGVTVDPMNDEDPAYSLVRLDWPVPGQPGFEIGDDAAFIAAVTIADDYDQQYEAAIAINNTESYTRTIVYTRVWRVGLVFYGPNSFDRARQVKSCFMLQFSSDYLAGFNLYQHGVRGTPRRAPELFQNQWWPRVDFSVTMNEQVTETIILPSMSSVELILQDACGVQQDDVILFDGFGFGVYGDGIYGGGAGA